MTNGSKGSPTPLVLFGPNSSGKTSFVDGIEWFLSPNHEIEWLKREDAKEKAYPHQGASQGDSFVEITFEDGNKKTTTLTKKYNHSRVTQPDLSSQQDFDSLYKTFVIKPHLRYLEIVDFVYNQTGLNKYKKLAEWMGFEEELRFQEKISLQILPILKEKEKELLGSMESFHSQIANLAGIVQSDESGILQFCNGIFKKYGKSEAAYLVDALKTIDEMEPMRQTSEAGVKISKLSEAENAILSVSIEDGLVKKCAYINVKIKEFQEEKEHIGKIDVIDLYTKALDILNKKTEEKVGCPVCGIEWEKDKLVEHVKKEFELLENTKKKRDELVSLISDFKISLAQEKVKVSRMRMAYAEAKKIIPTLDVSFSGDYQKSLENLEQTLSQKPINEEIDFQTDSGKIASVETERNSAVEQIQAEKVKMQPSKEERERIEDVGKLVDVKKLWQRMKEVEDIAQNFSVEISKFIYLGDKLTGMIQGGIKERFEALSTDICKYFGILRTDKDVCEIKIVLNEEKGRAAGRSAEIQLKYYDIEVKPAYKVLSESLLNSLGLAVYFTCVKHFNKECGFIVLDDIINSLDKENRNTVLDLIEQEFGDYQIVLFTHDDLWFQQIQNRFPGWVRKKIKNWNYSAGPEIDFAKTTLEEVDELLGDSTKVEDAGFKIGKHIEGRLNELCEGCWAEVRYRFLKNSPPSMSELFEALRKRLGKKAGDKHSAVQKLENAKKYEPLLRNFMGHPRQNVSSNYSSQEIRRSLEEWLDFEKEIFCVDCKKYVSYNEQKGEIECECGKLSLKREQVTSG